MVGALARLNLNYDLLAPEAKEVAETLDLRPVNCNPFMNSAAQVVEIVHCVEDSIRLKLYALPGETVVFPGHNYGMTPTSTIEQERTTNAFVRG